MSASAWVSPQEFHYINNQALKARFNQRWRIELMSEVTRAFSAGGFSLFTNPGALPQACDEGAPLALTTYDHHAIFLFLLMLMLLLVIL